MGWFSNKVPEETMEVRILEGPKKHPIETLISGLSGWNYTFSYVSTYQTMEIGRLKISRCNTGWGTSNIVMADGMNVFMDGKFCFDGAEKLEPAIIKAIEEKLAEEAEAKKRQEETQKLLQDRLIESFKE